ncbi:phospholipase D-like domain-containing protein [Streptomyces bikiniensis]|uniref:phospholipase D-like domain-containing protein n=1 Tax=Streptomyces bikiniensis TaxID=1896 RepID=UPI0004BEA740|nr:phospholipase D-like domain-containing protein [Streptomyces bikiniensis]
MRMRTSLPLAVAVTAALVTGVPAPLAAAGPAPVPTVTTGAVFNDPTSTDPIRRNAIFNHLSALIDGAVPGSDIKISLYMFMASSTTEAEFSSVPLAQRLVAAHQRGVNVQVLLDGKYVGPWNTSYTELKKLQDRPEGSGTHSWVRSCAAGQACLATRPAAWAGEAYKDWHGVNHNKLFLFSQTKGSGTVPVNNVVVQSSGNLTTDDRKTFWNDALTVTENAELYSGYDAYFTKQVEAWADPTKRLSDVLMDKQAGRAKAYFFPRQTSGPDGNPDDVILNILNTVDNPVPGHALCHGNSSGVGLNGRTVIRIAQGGINRPAIAKKLYELDKAGCYVDVVYGSADAESLTWLKKSEAPYNGVTLHELHSQMVNGQEVGTTTHNKYLIIEGAYKGVPDQKIVFTGSHTYTKSALIGNDEALLKWDDSSIGTAPHAPSVFEAYRDNFRAQRAAADSQNVQP